MKRVYFIGIGGIGMSALARFYRHAGYSVSGYDRTPSPLTRQLEKEGIDIHYEARTDLIPEEKEDTLVIYTPAIPSDMAELAYVRERGYQVIKRSMALGEITSGKRCLAVAGTHGKTTTTTLLAHILRHSGKDCSAFLGGISKNYGSNLILGKGDTAVVEADEFDRSFLCLAPETAVITSMDADHLDIYGSREGLMEAFGEFAGKVTGNLIVRKDLEEFFRPRTKAAVYTYSLSSGGDFHAGDLTYDGKGHISFGISYPGGSTAGCMLGVPGRVNIENAVAAFAAAYLYGCPPDEIKSAMASFRGAARRLEIRLETPECTYIDDYAHHPAELAAAISSIREIYPGKKICGIFQPHLYSRTRDFMDGFAESLGMLDSLILLPIYPAREKPIKGVTSGALLEKVGIKDRILTDKGKVIDELLRRQAGIVVTFGAGDIDRLAEPVEKALKERCSEK